MLRHVHLRKWEEKGREGEGYSVQGCVRVGKGGFAEVCGKCVKS